MIINFLNKKVNKWIGANVIFVGNSFINSHLYPTMTADPIFSKVTKYALGVPGYDLGGISSAASYFVSGVENIALFYTATNSVDLSDIYTNRVKTAIQTLKGAGYKVFVFTCVPAYFTASTEAQNITYNTYYQTFNTKIKQNPDGIIDGVIDTASDPHFNEMADCFDTVYYSDKIHPTTLGNTILSNYGLSFLKSKYHI